MTETDKIELKRLWFLLKGEQGRVSTQPEFYYDAHFTFFIRSDRALCFLDALLDDKKYEKKNIRENFEVWKTYLEQNIIAPKSSSDVDKENKKIENGFSGPYIMPNDIKLAKMVIPLIKDFETYKKPETYESSIFLQEYGIHYVPVINVLKWIDERLKEENKQH